MFKYRFLGLPQEFLNQYAQQCTQVSATWESSLTPLIKVGLAHAQSHNPILFQFLHHSHLSDEEMEVCR